MKYEINNYRDGQISVDNVTVGDLEIKIRGNSYEDLFKIASIKEAWDAENRTQKNKLAKLTIFCLIGQRSDRRFHTQSSFDLKVIADFINEMHFDEVKVLHPHSSVLLALVHNSVAISHYPFVKKVFKQLGAPTLVSPDAGAFKTTYEIATILNADLIPANKVRINGNPIVQIQGDVHQKECLIIDDLADGGRTFIQLAEALRAQGASKVFLYVTHGQFHDGFDRLLEVIDHIFCTNSYRDISADGVTQFAVVL